MSTDRIFRGAMRTSVMLLLVPALLVSGCAKIKSARRARIERHLDIAKVFESTEPYSTRTMSDTVIAKFLASNADYRADSADITDFYAERHNQFAWILGDSISENAETFAALTGIDDSQSPSATKATRHLSALYNRGMNEGKRVTLCDSCATELELRLTGEYYRYVNRTNAGDVHRDLNTLIPPAKRDYKRLLDSLVANKMDLAGYEPPTPQYKLLKEQVQKYSKFAKAPWPELELPAGKKQIKPGDSTAVIADIGARLHTLGDLADSSATERYDSAMVSGVKRFQSRHGMHPDGTIDADFLRALNISPAERIRTMLVNMERMRWSAETQPTNLDSCKYSRIPRARHPGHGGSSADGRRRRRARDAHDRLQRHDDDDRDESLVGCAGEHRPQRSAPRNREERGLSREAQHADRRR